MHNKVAAFHIWICRGILVFKTNINVQCYKIVPRETRTAAPTPPRPEEWRPTLNVCILRVAALPVEPVECRMCPVVDINFPNRSAVGAKTIGQNQETIFYNFSTLIN